MEGHHAPFVAGACRLKWLRADAGHSRPIRRSRARADEPGNERFFRQLRGRIAVAILLAAAVVAMPGCGTAGLSGGEPSAVGSTSVESPSAAGCPITFAEAQAAIPSLVSGPEINLPFKNVTASCTFATAQMDVQGRPAGFGILVFDAQGTGSHMWDSARSDPNFPNMTAVPGLGDDAFVTGTPHFTDLFAVQGQVALHISTLLPDGLTVEQFSALARSAFGRLKP